MDAMKRQRVESRLEQVRDLMHTMIRNPELLDAFPDEVYVPLDADLSSLFAPTRLELLHRISEGSLTVSELARALHRKVPAVSRDLRAFESRGLVRFEVRGRRKIPRLRRSLVVLPLASAGKARRTPA